MSQSVQFIPSQTKSTPKGQAKTSQSTSKESFSTYLEGSKNNSKSSQKPLDSSAHIEGQLVQQKADKKMSKDDGSNNPMIIQLQQLLDLLNQVINKLQDNGQQAMVKGESEQIKKILSQLHEIKQLEMTFVKTNGQVPIKSLINGQMKTMGPVKSLTKELSELLRQFNQKGTIPQIKNLIPKLKSSLLELTRSVNDNGGVPNESDQNEIGLSQTRTQTQTQTQTQNLQKEDTSLEETIAKMSLTSKNTKDNKGQQSSMNYSPGPMHRLQQFVLHSQKPSQPVQSSDVMKQIQALIAKNGLVQTKSGIQQLQLKLYPEHLGELTITIQKDSGGMTASIAASTSTAKELLQSQVNQLKQVFTVQNIPVNKIEIYDQAPFDTPQQQPQQQQQNQNQGQQQNESSSYTGVVVESDDDVNHTHFNDWLVNRLNESMR